MFLRPVGFESTIRGAFPVWEEYQITNEWEFSGIPKRIKLSDGKYDFALAYVNGRDLSNKESLIDIPPLNLSKIQYLVKEWHDLKLELKSENCTASESVLIIILTNIVVNNELTPV
jgi:iron complex outermembrane receptor protein